MLNLFPSIRLNGGLARETVNFFPDEGHNVCNFREFVFLLFVFLHLKIEQGGGRRNTPAHAHKKKE